ncbi:MAG: hypothetical protein PHG71_02335, partial [Kiritimatiellae bacterium]|nr:hypothetical protein [Kiritimatiellia bacterium]
SGRGSLFGDCRHDLFATDLFPLIAKPCRMRRKPPWPHLFYKGDNHWTRKVSGLSYGMLVKENDATREK